MTVSVHGRVVRGDLCLDIDIEVPSGPVAVVGANGSGKTTLLRTIAGLEALESGEIQIDGRIVDDAGASFVHAHRREVAMGFQEPRLLDHRTAVDNVALGARRLLSSRDARLAAATTLATIGGVAAEARTLDLSGGQRQRVSLARALVVPTAVLLLDEPLASIDEDGRRQLRPLITAIVDRPVLWVTHDPADAAGLPTVAVDSGRARLVGQTGTR